MTPSGPSARSAWRRALCLSVLIHAALGLMLSRLGSKPVSPDAMRPAEQSWCVYAEDDENITVALEPRARFVAASMKPIVRPTSIDRGPEVGPGPPAILVNPGAPPASESVATGAGPRAGIPDGVATTFFDVPARGRSIVYLIDASSSMGPSGALALATRELLASLARLPADARFQVLTYNSRVTPLLPRYPEGMPASPLMLDQVAQALRELEPVGATDHGRALREALNLRSDALFFLTDADDLTADHLRIAAQSNRGWTVIHVIELTTRHRGRPDMPMQVLARAHRGTYHAVDLTP